MLYNAQRKRVKQWESGELSTCPDCQRALFARRGELVIWHWAHYARDGERRAPCGHIETAWHLQWKNAYDRLPNWTVEAPLSGFRVDAVNFRSGSVREFIHSLSPYYRTKHHCLVRLNYDTRWIFDGGEFVSSRLRHRRGGAMARLLKPLAYQVHCQLSNRCWVHFMHRLWKEWRDNVWYPREDDAAARLLQAFSEAGTQPEPFALPK
jgi:hypothetical protein